ncbi:MAG TPA: c-type cytochrome biogenesis protein CcmI [Quisquiliibacterium sp.]|nr:c-type cytochrome biogenesis protein CcmI [Quisquiliibacterium sp.]
MLSFWVLLGLLTCGATALVVWPLLNRRSAAYSASDEEDQRLAVYRDRRREIERDRQAGRLTGEEAAHAVEELVAEAAQQFPNAGSALREAAAAGQGSVMPWVLVSAVAVPLLAVLVYAAVGSPAIVGIEPSALRGEITPARIEQAVTELSAQVARNPQDGEAWAMLAEGLRLQDKPAQAAEAYAKAVDLNPPHARLLADYAETLVLLSNGDFSGRPVELLERALRIDPNDGKAIALMGAAQFRLGNLPEALRYLKQLSKDLPPGSEEAARLAEAIDRIEAELASRGPAGAAAGPGPSAQPAPAPASGAGAQATPSGAGISGLVTIDDSLRSAIGEGSVLFVVARDPDGPRTPLAAIRIPVGGWPVRFSLDDAQSMDPSRPLSKAPSLVVEARVSASGDAMRRSGDPIGTSAPQRPGAVEVPVRIDRRVP